jgi:hypothetical protein
MIHPTMLVYLGLTALQIWAFVAFVKWLFF